MANINATDNLFASATIMGRQVFQFAGSGIGSLGELINRVRNTPGLMSGLVTLTVRNTSQGWSQSRDFYLAAV
ncbi:MAG: hypothetical protein K2M19_01540 [Muribaculaceae bacterium]|nr:hypothetical protein [Muribaculaceae bacterium]